ncbi:MAG: prepilin-type N-terminal cleavage/methylation domain-containing protein [Candidatus Moraniibacteriota bacterium]
MLGKQKKTSENKKGFTLIETLISVFLFSFLMVMIAGSFTSFLKTYVQEKKMQNNIEQANFAMNLMAKTLRTSDVVYDATNSILNVYDFSQEKCLRYRINGTASNKKLTLENSKTIGAKSIDECDWANMQAPQDLTLLNNGSFKSVRSTLATDASPSFGYVLINLSIQEPGQTGKPLALQTAVSLRNYR